MLRLQLKCGSKREGKDRVGKGLPILSDYQVLNVETTGVRLMPGEIRQMGFSKIIHGHKGSNPVRMEIIAGSRSAFSIRTGCKSSPIRAINCTTSPPLTPERTGAVERGWMQASPDRRPFSTPHGIFSGTSKSSHSPAVRQTKTKDPKSMAYIANAGVYLARVVQGFVSC
jgi:hypothetical protein